jgi:hypothetical protein
LAAAILVIWGFVESFLQNAALKGAGSDQIYVSWADWTPDGSLRYHGYQWQERRGYAVRWYYDESLTTPVKWRDDDQHVWSMFPSGALEPIDPKGGERTASQIMPLLMQHLGEEADTRRILWWNGFEGHLEEYDVYSARRLASLGSGEEAVLAPAKPAEKLAKLRLKPSSFLLQRCWLSRLT